MSKTTMEGNKVKGGSIGLSYPTLTRENYTAWSMKMRVYMQAHGVWEAVEPSDPKAVVEGKTDKIALAMIYQGIPEDVLLSLADKKTSKEAWEAIKTICQGADRAKTAKVQTLQAEFEALVMKETDKIDDFYLKINGLVSNMRALGSEVSESYVVKKLLRAVPPKFLQIASTIEQFGDLEKMTIEETIGSLKTHEERMRGQAGANSSANKDQLLLTEAEWLRRETKEDKLLLTREEWQNRSANRGTEGSMNARGRWNRDKSHVRCFNCQAYGHYAAECKKPKRFKKPEQEANLHQTEVLGDEPALLLTECGELTNRGMVLLNEKGVIPVLKQSKETNVDTDVWYLDNGASNHMTGQRSKFSSLDETVTGQVRFGDNSTVTIRGKGSVTMNCKNGETRKLHEVYYIPSLHNNIISLGQLSEEGNKVVLQGEYLWVRDDQGKLLMKVQRTANRLYKIRIESSEHTCLISKVEKDTWLWHSRLGHVNFAALIMMSKEEMAHGLPKLIHPKALCDGCLMSKQTRSSFPAKSIFCAQSALELIHADICGPFTPQTSAGNRYFLLLVDDFSRYMWVYLLKSKDEALTMFKTFRKLVEKESDKVIKVLRTDRGGELCSKEFWYPTTSHSTILTPTEWRR